MTIGEGHPQFKKLWEKQWAKNKPQHKITEERTLEIMNAHPKRKLGKATAGGLEAEMNHHHVYYEKIFEAMAISAKKNHDYAGGLDKHPLGNFLKTADSGIDPKIGLWVRMTDKIGRISTFFREGELKVDNEGLEDAFMDLGNYCFLMLALLSEEEDSQIEEASRYDLDGNPVKRKENAGTDV